LDTRSIPNGIPARTSADDPAGGGGYGKSTALAELAESAGPLAWYQVNEEDNDPLVFLLHLCHAFLRVIPDLPDLPSALPRKP
jgi:ATP/maltotriose-dependent transcriptional regulator MalT